MKLIKHLLQIAAVCGVFFAPSALRAAVPTTIADVSGNGTASAIATAGTAHWIMIQAAPTNSTTACSTATYTGCPRVGDSNITTTRGYFLTPGTSIVLPSDRSGDPTIPLNTVYYLVQSGDKITITYGN